MGRADLANDDRFGSVASRIEHYAELSQIILEFSRSVPDAETFERVFAEAGLATGQVRQPGELADTDWAIERGATVEIDDRAGGTVRVPNVPWRFSDSPDVGVSGIPKYRGEDNRTLLVDLLGYDAEQLDQLESDGVLSSRLPS